MHFIHIGHILKLTGLLFLVLQLGPNDVANFYLFCFGNTSYAIWRDPTVVGRLWRVFFGLMIRLQCRSTNTWLPSVNILKKMRRKKFILCDLKAAQDLLVVLKGCLYMFAAFGCTVFSFFQLNLKNSSNIYE